VQGQERFTFHPDLAVGLLLTRLEVRRRLQVIDADDGRGRLVVDDARPILLRAHLRALPIDVVYRRAAAYLQLAARKVLVGDQEL